MNEGTYGGYPNSMYGGNNEWPPPPSNSMTSNFGHQQISYPHVGWNYNQSPACPEVGSSTHGFQNYHSDWYNNNQGSWNMGNRGGSMTRGPPPRNGRPVWARGFGGGSRFSGPPRPHIPPSGDYYCDSCERGFMTPEDLLHHQQSDHIICGLEGCTLSAHPKIVEKHQRMQHDSGLYTRVAAASSQNPEDVQKWITERKKNYPTKENVDRRKREQEECMKRGETLGLRRGSRFGRPRGGMKNRGRNFGDRGRSWRDNGPRGGRGFGRGMHRRFDGRGGRHQRQFKGRRIKKMPLDRRLAYSMDDEPRNVPMFPGTAYLLGVPLDKSPSSDEEQENVEGSFSDSEWTEEKKQGEEASSAGAEKAGMANESEDKEDVATKTNTIMLTNALGALMGTYASDDSDEDDPPVQTQAQGGKDNVLSNAGPKGEEQTASQDPTQVEKPSTLPESGSTEAVAEQDADEEGEESDGSAPEEVAIVKGGEEGKEGDQGQEAGGAVAVVEGEGEKKPKRSRKRTRGKGSLEGPSREKSPVSDVKKAREQRTYVLPNRNPTLLEELLKNEIRHERNVILQCIRYAVERNFFDPVPAVHAEEEYSTDSKEDQSLRTEDDSIAATSDISTEKCSEMNVQKE